MQNSTNEVANRAPVEYMRLIAHIRPSGPLRMSSMSSFSAHWLKIYPEIDEHPPLPGAPSTSEFEFLDDDNYWPMPFTAFSSPETGRGIMFQADRVGVFWERTSTNENEAAYPGFQAMKNALVEVFDEFADHAGRTDISIELDSVECLYENTLENTLPTECVLGRLTNWADTTLDQSNVMDKSSSFNVHDYHDGAGNRPVWVSLHPLEESSATRMLIRSVVADADQPLNLLMDASHEVATQQYVNWVPQAIRNGSIGGNQK